MPITTRQRLGPDAVETAAWLMLDVADLLRQSKTSSMTERAIQTGLQSKINRQLTQLEHDGDPMVIVRRIRKLLGQR